VFNRLLLDGLVPGSSGVNENRAKFVLKRSGDETILVFRLDSSAGRQCLGLPGHSKAADALLAVFRKSRRPVLLFVELKGSDVKHGMQQLQSTVQTVKKVLGNQWSRFEAFAVVVRSSGASPKLGRDIKRLQTQMLKTLNTPATHMASVNGLTLDAVLKELG